MLESMKHVIESNYGNQCELHLAKTGRAVIEQAQMNPPDICIVDIHMPGLSGIQAIREIKKFHPSTIFIIITAYDKFNYAQEAVNLGVMEFLTKPVNKRTLLEVCDKAIARIEEGRQKRQSDLAILEKLETVIPMIESGYINSLLLQDTPVSEKAQYRKMLDINDAYGYILVIEFGDKTSDGRLDNAIGASVKGSQHYSVVRETAQSFFTCLVGPIMGNTVVLLVPHGKASVDYEERIEILSAARNMVHKLESRIDSGFRCGIGRTRELDTDIKDSYREAMRALRENNSHVVHIADLPAAQKHSGDFPHELEQNLYQHAREKDFASVISCADTLYEWMISVDGDNREDIEIKVLEIVIGLEKQFYFEGGSEYGFKNRGNALKEIQRCADLKTLKQWFLDRVRETGREIEMSSEKETNSVIGRAKAFIAENYSGDITLDETSRQVDISPYYFSKLFKQETGQNFIEYLTEIRLKKAKELLGHSELSIKEICVRCGYSDPNYFSRIFKKYEGVTPSEFRERLG